MLLLQDTTTFDFSDHPATQGLGTLENAAMRGFLAHTTLAVSMSGEPLGVVKQLVWRRPPAVAGSRHARHTTPFAEKESYKWVEGLPDRTLAEGRCGPWITVCDREAHIYAFLEALAMCDLDFIVRAAQGRSTTLDAENNCAALFDAVAQQPLLAESRLTLKRHPAREARSARVAIRSGPVTLKRPRRTPEPSATPQGEPLSVTVVDICELDPPAGEEAVHWLLLTSLAVTTAVEAQQVADSYALRWMVERFHYILKSGCKIEESQLREAESLERLLALYTLVAWRILQMTYQARLTPDLPCTLVLTPDEWQALYLHRYKSAAFPEQPPPLRQAVRWIAELGGFLGRKGDGEPGVKVIWRGWTQLVQLVDHFVTFRQVLLRDVGNA